MVVMPGAAEDAGLPAGHRQGQRLEVAEHYAEGMADADELRAARLACRFAGSQAAWYAAATSPTIAARNAALSARHGAQAAHAECLAQVELLRDIFFTPFHLMSVIDSSVRTWNDGDIVNLATSIYGERSLPEGTLDVQRLAILGDALEEAGCTNVDILSHCRQPGAVHVWGCWLVDLLLEKE
jgi:hypothetical protein